MEAGLSLARTGPLPAFSLRPDPAAQTVNTDLDASRAVNAAADSNATALHDPAQRTPSLQDTAQNIVLDPQSREVIFREISKRSGEVLDQIPGDAMLKMRAYFREVTSAPSDHKVLEKTT